jgi:DNA-binding HxlR family transcriptional regulator
MSTRKPTTNEFCPVLRCVDLIGDRWSLLIVRDAFDGMRRFGDFQRSLGVARNILSDRLKKLVDADILAMQGASDGTAYQEYVLTTKGKACSPSSWRCGNGGNNICSNQENAIHCWLITVPESRFHLWP